MRGRRKITVEVGEETRTHLDALLEEIHALSALVEELRAQATAISDTIGEQITSVVEAVGGAYNGSAADPSPQPVAVAEGGDPFAARNPYASGTTSSDADDPSRRRAGPFTRTPRHLQVRWLQEVVMADGEWYAPITIARQEANDERHFRYLRHAIAGRMREMLEEGLVERRDSLVKGSMYDYRLKSAD